MTTDAQWQAQIIAEVGDVTPAILPAMLPTIWAMNADQAYIGARMQYLLTKVQVIDVILGAIREQVTTEAFGDVKINLTDKARTLSFMHKFCDLQIAALRAKLRANRPVAVGQLTNVTPTVPPSQRPATPIPIAPDANAAQYKGDAYADSLNSANPYNPGQ